MRFASLLLVTLLLFTACSAPEPEAEAPSAEAVLDRPDPSNAAGLAENEVPPHWLSRFDHAGEYSVGANPDSSDVFFVTMTPGWHVTTKPAGIFWHPGSTAEGAYSLTSKIHLFDPGDRNEGLGVFFGGSALQDSVQAYVYFLVRRSGEFLVKRRAGENTETLIGWTASPAVVPFTEETEGTATNALTVTVDDTTVHFLVNDTEVATLPKEGLVTDGIAGLRINHALNVHVEDFTVTPAGT